MGQISNPSTDSPDDRPSNRPAHRRSFSRLRTKLAAPLRTISFWGAIALPAGLLWLLASGLESPTTLLVFVGLLALNVLALYAGHEYNQPNTHP